jgi:hypothetical protein
MQALTLQELFGTSASQTATELVIKKSDLVAIGLTVTANNRAEQLAVAVLLKALSAFQGYLTDESGNIICDETGNIIGYDNRELYEFLEIFRWNSYIKEKNDGVYLTETIVIHSYAQTD